MKIRVLLATLAGALVIFVLGYLIYGMVLISYLKENMIQYPGLNKEPLPDFVPLLLSNPVLAFLLAFIFEYWAKVRTFVGGLKSGAVIMFLMALTTDLSFLGYMNLFKGFTPVIVDVGRDREGSYCWGRDRESPWFDESERRNGRAVIETFAGNILDHV